MTRRGKVAQLPDEVREELNRRLEDGEAAPALLEWLNGLPEVRRVLKKLFAGADITPQNLSEWRQGGYVDWVETNELEKMIGTVRKRASDLECATPVSEGVAAVLSAELARMTVVMLREAPDSEARWERLERLLKQLNRLRRGDQRAEWARIKEEQWQLKRVEFGIKEQEKENQQEFNRQWVLPAMQRIEAEQEKMRQQAEEWERREAEARKEEEEGGSEE